MSKQKTAVVGLSGGVDSSVAALLLKKQNYNVIGAFMKNFSDTKNRITGECLWVEEKKMAAKIANILKIPLITFDFEKEYKKEVILPMYKMYKAGLTPNPDITCNAIIKFPLFWKKAKKLGADYIATGHYARIKKDNKGYHLLTGKDKSKDQSYFLYKLKQEDLKHVLFPIGEYSKKEVREIARKNKFPNYNKKSTAGICFVGKINMKKFLEKRIKNKKGKVILPDGEEIGIHDGIMYYTIGQKVGPHIGINIKKPEGAENKRWYIAKKKKNNILVVAPENHPALKRKSVIIKNTHIINKNNKIPESLNARIRSLGEFIKGNLIKKSNNYQFIFKKPLEGVAPGQSIVLYKNEEVIGGGEIR